MTPVFAIFLAVLSFALAGVFLASGLWLLAGIAEVISLGLTFYILFCMFK